MPLPVNAFPLEFDLHADGSNNLHADGSNADGINSQN
jgi:hypothetical protein